MAGPAAGHLGIWAARLPRDPVPLSRVQPPLPHYPASVPEPRGGWGASPGAGEPGTGRVGASLTPLTRRNSPYEASQVDEEVEWG